MNSFRKLKTNKPRPLSAKRLSPARSKRASRNCEGILTLEDKTEENIQLKTQVNSLKSELLKLRVKLKTNENETKREELSSERHTLVVALKQQVKELSKKLGLCEKELDELKRSVKATSFQELEVQVKMYIDECTRLRRLLHEAMEQISEGAEMGDIAEKYLKLSIQFREAKKEHVELSETAGNLRMRKKPKDEDVLDKLKKNLVEVQEENTRIHNENQQLITELQSVKQMLKCPNCEQTAMFNETIDPQTRNLDELVSELWAVLNLKKIDLRAAWQIVDSNRADILKSAGFGEGLKKLGMTLSPMELTKMMLELNPVQGNKVTFAQFEAAMLKRKAKETENSEEIQEILTHLRMRLQVRRWEFDQLPVLIAPERRDYLSEEIISVLSLEPFELTYVQSSVLANYLFRGSPCLKSSVIVKRLTESLAPWEVLSEAHEQELDDTIRKSLSLPSDQFVRYCSDLDTDKSGLISFSAFAEVLKKIKVSFSKEVLDYIQLLCYTHNFELDSVPYLHLASAYVDDV